MAINPDSRWDAGIGLTEALQATESHLRAIARVDELCYYGSDYYLKDKVSVLASLLHDQAQFEAYPHAAR